MPGAAAHNIPKDSPTSVDAITIVHHQVNDL